MVLTPEQIAAMKAAREQKLKSLKNTVSQPVTPIEYRDKGLLVAYKVNLRVSDRDYMRDYVYTMTQRLGRLYTMTEALEDAVKALKENTNFNIIQKPLKK